VHLVGFIVRIYHDVRSTERQTVTYWGYNLVFSMGSHGNTRLYISVVGIQIR